MQDLEIVIEHVRSFSKRQTIPLRPLTLLVGENSSGKTTLLALVSAIFNQIRFPGNPSFNDPPYNLGTFDTIATHKGGRYGRDSFFGIGFSTGETGEKGFQQAIATYENASGKVALKEARVVSGPLQIKVFFVNGKMKISLKDEDGKQKGPFEIDESFSSSLAAVKYLGLFWEPLIKDYFPKLHVNHLFSIPFESTFSFAPIRSKPRRTYDELDEEYSPEGDHIPTLLARLLKEEPSSSEGQRVLAALLRFGKESGLFNKVDVKKLGKKASDPFQVQVTVTGPPANLIDVGYGVSQALPIVVQSVLKTRSRLLLMQQPEVHLHPRAQAALGSFFASLVANDERMFLIETHSDFLVDRIRQEVACGNLSPEKVLILFFHKPELETTVWPISIDQHGNIEDAPPEYRSFFLREELNLLGRTGQ